MNSDPHTDLVTVQSATPARPGERIRSRFEVLTLDTDPCPTGIFALDADHRLHLPLLPWFAARRQADSIHGPQLPAFYTDAIRDIEMIGLLRQAEAAMSGAN
jgi:hypothetical protein